MPNQTENKKTISLKILRAREHLLRYCKPHMYSIILAARIQILRTLRPPEEPF